MTITDSLTLAMKASGHGQVNAAMRGVSLAARGLNTVLKGVGVGAGIATGALTGIGIAAVKTASDFQQMKVQLDTVMGSAAAGKQAFSWLTAMEPRLPGTLKEITGLFTTLQQAGMDPFRTLPTVLDGALGDMERAQRIALALSQIKTNRVVQGDEIMQLAEGGMIPAKQIMADTFRLTERQLANIGNVRIPADSAIRAILDWTKQNRGGAAERQMAGIAGKLSSLVSAKDKFLSQIGMALSPSIIAAMDKITAFLSDPKTIGKALKFTSYIVAGFEVAATMARQLMDTVFNKKAPPVWLLQVKKELLHIAAIVLAVVSARDAVKGVFNGRPGDALAAILTGATGAPILETMSKATDKQIQAAMKEGGPGAHPKITDVFKSSQQAHYAKFMAGYEASMKGVGGTPTPRAGATGGTAPAAVENALQRIVEQQILGGAERARRGIKGMDLIRSAAGRPKPAMVVRFETNGRSFDKMIQDGMSKAIRKWVEEGGASLVPAR